MLVSADESSVPTVQHRVPGSVLTRSQTLGYKEDTKICVHYVEKKVLVGYSLKVTLLLVWFCLSTYTP